MESMASSKNRERLRIILAVQVEECEYANFMSFRNQNHLRTIRMKSCIQFSDFRVFAMASLTVGLIWPAVGCIADDMRSIALKSTVTEAQPMTGIVLWTTNAAAAKAPIQLEYSYMTYAQIAKSDEEYDWTPLERLLDQVASRGHQLVLRWHDTYVGQTTGVPKTITGLSDYKMTRAMSENKPTEFPDWSHPKLKSFVLDFFRRFTEKYDRDSRLAFVQVGFGLWAEYHIYDGPMRLGETFPSKEFQAEFAKHLSTCFQTTPWMISVDAADGERAPYVGNEALLALRFGLFDDSFNHARHPQENEPNWNALGRDRWKSAPAGGEFSFFKKVDQSKALAPDGPHGIPFENMAADFHVSFIIGDDQLRFQKSERIREASLSCGYRFRVDKFDASETESCIKISNSGIAPIYYDAFPTVDGVRSAESLKGLLPGQRRTFRVSAGGKNPKLTIDCERLVKGQFIGFDANLQ